MQFGFQILKYVHKFTNVFIFLLGVVSVRYYAQMNAFCVFGEGIKETEIQKKIDELYNPKPKTRYLFGCIPM